MRARYWSNTKFADSLRKVFKLPPQPNAATAEGWDEFHAKEQSISPTGVAVIDFLDKIQSAIYFIPDKLQSATYTISNYMNDSHTLRTKVKRGGYSDLVTKVPDALMFAIIDFVEQECFWMNIAFDKERTAGTDLHRYVNQSYIRRKLFPIKVSDAVRGDNGLVWIQYQIDANEGSSEAYTKLIAAYKFAKDRYQTFDPYEESGYNALSSEEPVFRFTVTPKMREAFDLVHELESKFDEEVTEHCNNIIKYREYLWT